MNTHEPDHLPVLHLPVLIAIFLIAGMAALVESCVLQPAQAQPNPTQEAQEAAIESLEELLGQYEQGEFQQSQTTRTALAAAITELDTLRQQHNALTAKHDLLVNEHTALKARCP
jgi:hypothetical protein